MMAECQDKACDNTATSRGFWPGNEPALWCEHHRAAWVHVAKAMGFHLHTEPLNEENDNAELE